MVMIKCKYCGKKFNKHGIKSHIWRSHTNKGRNHKPAPAIPWNKDKTKETDIRLKLSKETKLKISKAMKGRKHTNKTKLLLSKLTKDRYKNGWEVRCGRSKKYKYNSKIAGNILVDGKWELAVACFLDLNHFNWKRNKKRFPYINLKGEESTYCPDFWIEDWNTYLEVKGYETDLDGCKWKQFKENLLIWKDKDLINRYIINKYGEVAEMVKALVC